MKYFFLLIGVIGFLGLGASSPETLSLCDPGSPMQLAMDAVGNAYAVWMEGGFVQFSTKSIDQSWTPAIPISKTDRASAPCIVVDPKGDATSIWIEDGVILASSKPYSGEWSPPITLSDVFAHHPRLAVDASGNVVSIWTRDWGRNTLIESSTKLDQKEWDDLPDVLSMPGGDSPCIAMSENGRVVAVWHAMEDANDRIYSAVKQVNGSWGPASVISDASHRCACPQVALDATGRAQAIWFRFTRNGSSYSDVILQASSRLLDGSWTVPEDLSKAGICDPADLSARISFDGSGNAIAAWSTSFNGSSFFIQTAFAPCGAKWGHLQELVTANPYAYSFDLVVDPLGKVLMSYMSFDRLSSALTIQSVSSDLSNSLNIWTPPQLLSRGSVNGYPCVRLFLNESEVRSVILWKSFNGLSECIQSLTQTYPLLQPPTNLSVVQDHHRFGLFDECFNILTWQPSSSPVRGYFIFRNGLLIGKVGPDIVQVTDANRKQDEPVTYGIASFDNNFSVSRITTIRFP